MVLKFGMKLETRNANCTRSYNESAATKQLWNWIMKKTNNTNEAGAIQYWKMVTESRPSSFAVCDTFSDYGENITFELADPEYFQHVLHRGGWKSVISYLQSSNIVSVEGDQVEGREDSILFLDNSELSFFVKWKKKRVRITRPWVGILHFPPSELYMWVVSLTIPFKTKTSLQASHTVLDLWCFRMRWPMAGLML